MTETNDIVRDVAAEMLNTSMQEITAERIHGWATRLGATCKESLQVGNAAKMREALTKISESSTYALKYRHKGLDYGDLQGFIKEIGEDAYAALSASPRYCDVMSLESARKLWFAKEIIPRLDGDLPLGKEVPFEEWFVSKLEQ